MDADAARSLLRHTIATVAYRGAKVVKGAPPAFASFRAGERTRTPAEILAHIGDLFEWALWLAKGQHTWRDSTALPWDEEIERFFRVVGQLDEYLASTERLECAIERLFQGPVADALTHIGQIALLRRLAGSPIRGENYFKADIEIGRVQASQTPPRVEFD